MLFKLFWVVYNDDIKNDGIIKPINLTGCRNILRENLVSHFLSLSNDYKHIDRIISVMIKAGIFIFYIWTSFFHFIFSSKTFV